MQITPQVLRQFADTTVEKYTRTNYDIMAVYLRGSLVFGDDPLLGGTTDIDLVFIHNDTPATEREILRLTDEVHLDIVHHSQREYLRGRELRIHPRMGPCLFNAQVLYDPRHFMDFTIATVRGMFHREDHIIMRSRPLVEEARQAWLELQSAPITDDKQALLVYLDCIEKTANALALLVGEPLSERRFLSAFAQRVEKLERTGMYAGILGLLGAPRAEVETLHDWVAVWETAFSSLTSEDRPVQIHPHRKHYYLKAFQALLESEQPKNVLWPLINTWIAIAELTPSADPAAIRWQEAFKQLGLLGTDFSERLTALDVYLEQAEEVIETWAIQHGA